MIKTLKKLCFTICIVLPTFILISCGGGSSGSSNSNSGPSNTTPTAPTVIMSNPANNSANASLNQTIQLQFSEAVTGVDTKTVTLHEGTPTGSLVNTTSITPSSNNIYTFSPASGNYLQSGKKYYVVVGSGITSVATGEAVEATNFNFSTGQFANPTVTMEEPANESTNVSVSTTIKLHFSESVANVNTNTVTLHEFNPTGKPVTIDIESGSDDTYVLTPQSNLDQSKTYFVVVNDQITSVKTGASLESATFNFKTSQTVASPTGTMINPSNNGLAESLVPFITIHFSESVINVNSSSVFLHADSESGTKVSITLVKTESHNDYVFEPSKALDASKTYYLELTNLIVSKTSGIQLTPAMFNFTTQSPNFLYFAAESGVSVCKITDLEGHVDESSCTLTVISKHAYKIAINPAHTVAYIISKNDNSVTACNIDKTDGTLNSCATTGNGFDGPTSLSFNKDGSYAYVTNYSANKILVCSVAESSLNNCTETGNIKFSSPSSIAIDSNNESAYITNSGSNEFNICSVSDTDGTLGNCTQTGKGSYKSLAGIALTTNYLYSTSMGNGQLVECQIDKISGALTCASDFNGVTSAPSDITASGHNIYIADSTSGYIDLCHPNESGQLNDCTYALANNVGLLGIATLR